MVESFILLLDKLLVPSHSIMHIIIERLSLLDHLRICLVTNISFQLKVIIWIVKNLPASLHVCCGFAHFLLDSIEKFAYPASRSLNDNHTLTHRRRKISRSHVIARIA